MSRDDKDSDKPDSSPAPATGAEGGEGPAPGQGEDFADDESTVTSAPDDAIHDLTTAAPDSPAEPEEGQRGEVEARPGEGGAEGSAAGGEDAPEGRQIRVPAPYAPPRPVTWVRMRTDDDALLVLDDEPEQEPLEASPGPLGEAEAALFRGDLDGAREKARPLAPEPGAETLTEEQTLALSLLIRAALMGGELDEARDLLEPRRDSDGLALADAAYSLALGQLERARKRIEVALQQRPRGLAESYTQALVLVAAGDVTEARALLEQVARSAPEHAVARHQLGQLVLAAGDPARAGTLFEQAIELAPDFVPPALSLAEMLADSRQYGEAMGLLGELCDEHPGLLAPRLLQLRILLAVGDVETAFTLADALRQAARNVPDIELLWAETVARQGDLDSARKALEALVGGGVEVQEKALKLLAQIELAQTPPAYGEAVAHLEKALAAAPSSPELLLEIAQVHLQASDMSAARDQLEKLASLPDVELGSLLSASVTAQNHGLFRTAIELAESALDQVRGTPAEGQISAFIAQLQGA